MIKIIRAVTISRSVGFFEPLVGDLQAKGYTVLSLSSPGTELKSLRNKGVKTIEVPMERRISVLKDIRSLLNIIRIFRKEKPYIVHSMTPKAGLLCMLAGWVCRVPRRVHTFTGLVWPTSSGLKRKVLMATDWLTCACATHVIPEGEGVKNDLLNNGITRKPLKVLGYGNVRGIDLTRFSRRPEIMHMANSLRKDNVFTFVFVGRIVKDKGINELCRAFNKLSGLLPVRLWLIGNYDNCLDPINDESRRVIAENPALETVGPKYGDDLLAYYAAADCFVFPSYREGFPNTVLEAGAMDLPSIVTDINGSREIIKHGENGVVIPSKDIDALYDAMLKMIRDNDGREYMAKNARKMVADRFEQCFVRKCLYEFYDEILPNA